VSGPRGWRADCREMWMPGTHSDPQVIDALRLVGEAS
jgi:hypothetical protein